MARETHSPHGPVNFTGPSNRPKANALYIGKVKRTNDPQRMGRVQIFVKNFGGIEQNPNTWVWCRMLSPFYGVTPGDLSVAGTSDWSKTQKSYGMWMPPPDLDTKVGVMFDQGDLSQGYIIGYPMDQYMNNMIPGNPSSTLKKIDSESPDYDAQLVKLKVSNAPVTEYNKSNPDLKAIDATEKPLHPFVDILIDQGLASDNIRGNTSSSARRETPSQVFGISTPGPVDFFGQISDAKQGNIHGSLMDKERRVTGRANSRQGGHTFVMDDGTPQESLGGRIQGFHNNELIRLRTRTGHQIVMHDTDGLIYIGSANGKAWMEFTADGKIDIFAGDSVSVHTKTDFNFKADRDVNIEAGRNINMKAEGTWKKDANAYHDEKLDDVSTGAIRLESMAETEIKVGGHGFIEVNQDFKMESVRGHIDIRATQVAKTVDDVVQPRKDVRIHATGDVDILAGNSANVDDSLTSNINLQAVTDDDNVVGNFNLKTSGKVSVDSVLDTSLKSTAKLQVSNAGTDIDGGDINLNSGTVSVTTAGASATAEQATIPPLLTHDLVNTDTQYVFPYNTTSKTPTSARGDTLKLKSIMKRMPIHEAWTKHENKTRDTVNLDRTDREYLEPSKEQKEANDLSKRVE